MSWITWAFNLSLEHKNGIKVLSKDAIPPTSMLVIQQNQDQGSVCSTSDPRLASSSPFSESVSRKRSGCSGSSAIITIHPTTDTFLFDVDLN